MARARVLLALAAIAILVVACGVTITRGPAFHDYADARTWLGIPHAGDVLSNLAFAIAAALSVHAPRAARAGVLAIAIGSAGYHVAPSDTTLALDWAPIVTSLAIITAYVAADRLGREAGRRVLAIGVACALGSVAWWLATGGTHGGNMAPYVAVQLVGVALPAALALVVPGEIRARWLVAAVALFALARLAGAHDAALLDAIGVSGHSLKHVVAALAAATALHALADSPG